MALQSSGAVHLGVDNLGIVRHVGRLLNGHHDSTPFELVTVFLVSVVDGILLFLIFIGSLLPFPGLLLTMTGLLLILWSGLPVPSPRGAGWFMRFETGHICLGHLVFGILSGLRCLHLLSMLRTLLIGPVHLVSWSNGLPFWAHIHWPAGGADLGVGGVSCVELLILYELWAGERLVPEKAHPR